MSASPLVAGVTTKTRTVYVFGRRSYLSRHGAEFAAARAAVRAELGGCCCEPGVEGFASPCVIHGHEFESMARAKLNELRAAATKGGAS